MTDTKTESPTSSGAAHGSAVSSRYAWRDENLLAGLETWEAEIAHMEKLGYKLVAPEYKVPHWAEAMRAGESLPTLYILGLEGPRKLRTHFDDYAANVGYPLFYQPNVESSATRRPNA